MTALKTGLDAHIVAEQRILSTGREITVYRCPYPCEGPIRVRGDDQRVSLVYMYAHFVFSWPEGKARVHIGHGTIERSMPLWRGHPIAGEWCADSLARFGYRWAREHIAAFQRPAQGRDRS